MKTVAQPVGVGVIGLGVGEAHAEAAYNHPRAELRGLCDISRERLDQVSCRYPNLRIRTHDAQELIAHPAIDLVVIASYDAAHFEQARLALIQGKHVMLEKPCCTSRAELDALQALVDANPKLHFSSNLILRRSPRFQRLKELLSRGILGDPYCVEGDYNYGRLEKLLSGWRGADPRYSITLGGGVHIIDLLQWLTGTPIVETQVVATKQVTQGSIFRGADSIISLLRFSSGIIGKLGVNFACTYPHTHRICIYGSQGTFENTARGALLYRESAEHTIPEEIQDPVRCHKGELTGRLIDQVKGIHPADLTPAEIFSAMRVCFDIDEQVARLRLEAT